MAKRIPTNNKMRYAYRPHFKKGNEKPNKENFRCKDVKCIIHYVFPQEKCVMEKCPFNNITKK